MPEFIDNYPPVDIIIPTMNCKVNLEKCLSSINKQDYRGKVLITIIDGGSTDGTIELARYMGANVIVKVGMYGTGKNGARHFGETITSNPLIWNVDSDNIIVETNVLSRLVNPFISDDTINISIPVTAIDDRASSFNNWISASEIEKVNKMIARGHKTQDGYVILQDMFYGLTNCTLIKRRIIETVEGYDSDIRTLSRIRTLELSKGVIDPTSHFYHNQVSSIINYFRKWSNRIHRFSKMNIKDLSNFFVDYPPKMEDDRELKMNVVRTIFFDPLISLKFLFEKKQKYWIWGVIYSLVLVCYIALNFRIAFRVFRDFL